MRRTGIDVMNVLPWGTHFCEFYETREDVIETLGPYFREGLAANEFCMWVTSGPLQAEDAERALKSVVPDLARHLEKGQIEFMDYRQWAVRWRKFKAEEMLRGWVDKMEAALRRGYQGLRLAWDASEIAPADWDEYLRSEELISESVGPQPILAVCTFSLLARKPEEVLQAAARHEFALIKSGGRWQRVESSRHKKMERMLQEGEARLRLAQSAAHVGLWEWDPERESLVLTPELEALYGLKRGTLRTYGDWAALVHPDDLKGAEAARDEAISLHRPFDLEFRIKHGSGETRWIHARGGALYDDAGRPTRVIGINVDVTENRRALETLRRQAGLLEQSYDAVLVWRIGGGTENWFPGAEKLYGFSEAEARERPPQELLATVFPQPWAEIETGLRERGVWEGDLRRRSRDGRDLIVSARLQLTRAADGSELVLETDRDISEEKRAEEELKALSLFPEENPYPVMRVARAGTLLFANNSSAPLLETWGCRVGQLVPEDVRIVIARSLDTGQTLSHIVESGPVAYEFSIAPIGPLGYANLYGGDVTERKRSEVRARQKSAILESINRIFHEALTSPNLEELGRTCLNVVQDLTQSRFGFMGRLNAGGRLDDIAVSDPGWEACRVVDPVGHGKLPGDLAIHGIYGRVITSSQALFTNRPSEHPDSIGLPEGHPALEAFLGAPLISAGKTIGIVALGNRPGGYTMEQLESLEAVTPAIVQALLSRQAKQELAEAGQRLAAHMDNSPLAVVEFDPQFRIIRWSKESEKLFGWSADEVLGKSIEDMPWVHGDDIETVRQVSADLLSGRRPRILNINRNYRKDGTVVQCEWYSSAIYDAEGKLGSVLALVLDLTRRKEAEAALRDSEERYRTIVETANEGIWLSDPDGQTLFVNKRVAEMLGYSTQEMIGAAGQQFLDRKFAAEVNENRRKLSQGQFTRNEFKFLRKDGSDLWAIVNSAPIFDAGGRHVRNISMLTDITQRKLAEEAVRRERDFVSAVLETTDALVVVLDPEGRILSFNRACERLTGYSFAEVQGRPLWDAVLPPEDADLIRSIFPSFQTSDYPREYENPWRTKDGERRPIAWTNTVLNDDRGLVSRIITIGIDISERRRAEQDVERHAQELQRLTESLEHRVIERTRELAETNVRLQAEIEERLRLAAAVEQAEEAMAIADAGCLINYVNPAFERVSGRPRTELLGVSCLDLLTGQGAGVDIVAKVKAAVESGEAWSGAVNGRGGDDQPRDLEVSVHPVRERPEDVVNFLVIERDVTQNVRLQQHVRQMQKVEALGTLAGGIAHDLNNILNPIFINVELALLDEALDPTLRRHLEMSLKAAERGRDLVKQIITFSRQKETGRKASKPAPPVREVLKFLRASLPKTVEIRKTIQEETGFVLVDQTQMHQVVMNLCNNAAYAMKEHGGVLDVGLGEIEVDAALAMRHPGLQPGPYVKLTVADTGAGMPPEIIERAFDPFFTTKKPGEGSGMGLAVVHSIVRDHGGAVSVQSEVGKGTTFDVYFPRVEAPRPSPDRSSGIIAGGTERILLVDDEEAQVRSVRKMLVRLGYRVTGRTGSAAALAVFKQHPELFDLVITDQTMPLMTGAKLAEEMFAVRPDIPIILYTGFSENIDAEGARAMGIREYLMKPFSFKEMAEAVRRALEKK